MTYIIIKKTERDLRERARESASRGFVQGHNIDGYARGMEEADSLLRSRGRDNPNQEPILVDDGGKSLREVEERAANQIKGRKRG